jgi:hypothetical protein
MRLDLKGKISCFAEKSRFALRREMRRLRAKMNRRRDDLGSREEFIEDVNDRALFSYIPRAYPGKITIYKPRTNWRVTARLFRGGIFPALDENPRLCRGALQIF